MKYTEDCLFVAPTPVKLAEEIAGWFYAQVAEQTSLNGSFCVAISGGNTPILFFTKLAEKYGNLIDWEKVHIFWADERCVPQTSNESNFKIAHTNLLSKIAIPDSMYTGLMAKKIRQKQLPNMPLRSKLW
jgi:6-phosphogluconolactonase/glucosamine-6-phosphate isomerase/deaminase